MDTEFFRNLKTDSRILCASHLLIFYTYLRVEGRLSLRPDEENEEESC